MKSGEQLRAVNCGMVVLFDMGQTKFWGHRKYEFKMSHKLLEQGHAYPNFSNVGLFWCHERQHFGFF